MERARARGLPLECAAPSAALPGERRVGELGEGQRTVGRRGAPDQIIAARCDRRPQHLGNGLEIRDTGLHVGKLSSGLLPKPFTVPRRYVEAEASSQVDVGCPTGEGFRLSSRATVARRPQ